MKKVYKTKQIDIINILNRIKMKRNIKLFTAIFAVALVAGASIFYACEKEQAIIHYPVEEEPSSKSLTALVDELMSTTGIDIYELSMFDEVGKVAAVPIMALDMALLEGKDMKGEVTEEKLTQLQNLEKAIQTACASGNEEEALKLYESFCKICMTIDGFIFSTNNQGLQTFEYDHTKVPVQLPLAQMESLRTDYLLMEKAVEVRIPQYTSLTPTVQSQVLSTAIAVSVMRSPGIAKAQQTPAQCRQAALESFALNTGFSTTMLVGGLARCAITAPIAAAVPPLVGVTATCVIRYFASYGVSMGWSYYMYRRDVKKCG